MKTLVTLALALAAQTATAQATVKFAGAPRYPGVATLRAEVSIGGGDATADEYLFSAIRGVLAAADGTVWVIDGRVPMGPFSVRQYSATGTFIRNIGRVGDGPGEWRYPAMLSQMRDGRVILKDDLVGRWLTFYKPNGNLDTTWAFQTSTIHSAKADTSNRVWLRMQAGVGFRSSSPISVVRFNASGALIDTVAEPPYAAVQRARLEVRNETSRGGSSSISVPIPFQPNAVTGWSPAGHFVRGVSSQYVLNIMPTSARERGISIRRTVPPIAVSAEERADQRAHIEARAKMYPGTRSGPIPDVPREKQVITSAAFDLDGRLWVGVTQPSERCDPPLPDVRPGQAAPPVLKWCEPVVRDVFEANGTYIGRVGIPSDVRLRELATVIQARGDLIWATLADDDGVPIVRRYRIQWK